MIDKKVYIKSWETNADSSVYCVKKEHKEEIEKLLEHFNYKIKIKDFDDKKSICFIKTDYSVGNIEFWYLLFTILKDNGYEFSAYLKDRYEWYKTQYLKIEEQRLLAKEKAELEKQERERQEKERIEKIEQEESEYGLLCNKYGCLTNIGFCINKCKYNTQYNMNCRPEMVKIKKEGI